MIPDNLFVLKIRFHLLLGIDGMKGKKTELSVQVIILLSRIVSNA